MAEFPNFNRPGSTGPAYLKLGVLPWRAAQAQIATEPGGVLGLDAMFVAKWAKLGSIHGNLRVPPPKLPPPGIRG